MHLPTSDLTRSLVALAATAALSLAFAGCSGGDEDPAASPAAHESSASSPGAGSGKPDKPEKSADPNSPFVVAASAVAERSRDQVTQLHVMGMATTGEAAADLPVQEIPRLAGSIRAELDRQISDTTMMPPPKGSPAADLVATLRDYQALAQDLADWEPGSAAMSEEWFDRLSGTDRHWKSALRKLGKLSDRDLLTDLPPLLLPS